MSGLRDYDTSARQDKVEKTYLKNHQEQTLDRVLELRQKWLPLYKGRYSVREALDMLDNLVDDSDPDLDLPNSVHAFQTAERAREAHPDKDWLWLVGLVHDLGKVMSCWDEPQHLVVGDTFVVGCEHPREVVFHKYFALNDDSYDSRYNTKYGIYRPNCGLENLIMSWGHDEYMYWVLKDNGCTIPQHGLDMIRYHSFYPWHTGGAYKHLTEAYDEEVTLPWIRLFNEYDLYSKVTAVPDCKRLWEEVYEPLCHKYHIGGKLRW